MNQNVADEEDEIAVYNVDINGTSQDGKHFNCGLTVRIKHSFPESWFENHFRPQLVFYIRQMIASHPHQWLIRNAEAAAEQMQDIASELMKTVTRPQ